ncbi:cell division protein [Pseudomonas sp. dw_358]|uniref:cell division protein n=1 Tax=Pseudomonas sp. dw_358 TaxID=2720083 RepID=UPI001BD2E215|nr:cell division protein [Pseudomonas sp. dw_358]
MLRTALKPLFSSPDRTRQTLIAWLYVAAIGHLAGGLALSWLGPRGSLDSYLHLVEHAFWSTPAPPAAQTQQRFWFGLFGATLQGYAIGLLALTHLGQRLKRAEVWAWMLLGILVWGSQDLWLSAEAGVWINVALDGLALWLLMPPMLWLLRHDHQQVRPSHPAP